MIINYWLLTILIFSVSCFVTWLNIQFPNCYPNKNFSSYDFPEFKRNTARKTVYTFIKNFLNQRKRKGRITYNKKRENNSPLNNCTFACVFYKCVSIFRNIAIVYRGEGVDFYFSFVLSLFVCFWSTGTIKVREDLK